jgi:hypothetical protein
MTSGTAEIGLDGWTKAVTEATARTLRPKPQIRKREIVSEAAVNILSRRARAILDNNSDEIFTVTNSSVEVTSSLNISGSVYITNVLDLSRSGSLLLPIERKPLTANTATGSIYVDVSTNELFVFTGNGGTGGWVSASLH